MIGVPHGRLRRILLACSGDLQGGGGRMLTLMVLGAFDRGAYGAERRDLKSVCPSLLPVAAADQLLVIFCV